MTPAYSMVAFGVVSALAAIAATGGRYSVEILAGMLGPLAFFHGVLTEDHGARRRGDWGESDDASFRGEDSSLGSEGG